MFRRALPVRLSAVVQAPADEVFALVSDSRNDTLWCPNVDDVEQVEGDGPAVGARFRYSQHLDVPGRGTIEFDGDIEVAELTDTSIRWRVSDRFQERDIAMSVTPVDAESCRVSQVTRARFRRPNPTGVAGYPLMARRELRRQFDALATHFT